MKKSDSYKAVRMHIYICIYMYTNTQYCILYMNLYVHVYNTIVIVKVV